MIDSELQIPGGFDGTKFLLEHFPDTYRVENQIFDARPRVKARRGKFVLHSSTFPKVHNSPLIFLKWSCIFTSWLWQTLRLQRISTISCGWENNVIENCSLQYFQERYNIDNYYISRYQQWRIYPRYICQGAILKTVAGIRQIIIRLTFKQPASSRRRGFLSYENLKICYW